MCVCVCCTSVYYPNCIAYIDLTPGFVQHCEIWIHYTYTSTEFRTVNLDTILHASATVAIAASLLRWINEAFRYFLFHEVCCDDCGVFTCAIIAKLPSRLVTVYREHNRTSRLSTHSGHRTRAGCHRRNWANNLKGQNRPRALRTHMPLFSVQ